jgi:deoxyribodipyrimidine photo-lyase
MNSKRIRILREGQTRAGTVVLWMSRDQRVNDNWALLFAQELAMKEQSFLAVVFCVAPTFLGATIRQYSFMIKGLQEVERELAKKGIPFFLLNGSPEHEIPKFVRQYRAGTLITDFNPLRIKRKWENSVAEKIDIPFYQVDAHNIVPCWIASAKQKYNAHTFRPKMNRLLSEFLVEYPVLRKHPVAWDNKVSKIDWERIFKTLDIDFSIPEVDWVESGGKAAKRALYNFIENKLPQYDTLRNDPTSDGQSNLSPYLHFGQISAQRVAFEVLKYSHSFPFTKGGSSTAAFLEELIIRRELSDNFCFYNQDYENFEGFPAWAKKTLNEHRKDRRAYIYTVQQFEHAKTHDDLWNAAQMEMVKKGKMHGYMRMYWAKKISEWTVSPEKAMEVAIYLNDRYELDGRDPNGYVGIAWSIGGVHDRAWSERPIFGKIRYMSYNGCKAKFDVNKYIEYMKSM